MISRSLRHRKKFTHHQKTALESAFDINSHIDCETKCKLARLLDLTEREVQVWFQNRRARMKRSVNNGDCNPIDNYAPNQSAKSVDVFQICDDQDVARRIYSSTESICENSSTNGSYTRHESPQHSQYEPALIRSNISIDGEIFESDPPIKTALMVDLSYGSITELRVTLERVTDDIIATIPSNSLYATPRRRLKFHLKSIDSMICTTTSTNLSQICFLLHSSPSFLFEMDTNSGCWFPFAHSSRQDIKKFLISAPTQHIIPFVSAIFRSNPNIIQRFRND